MKKLIIALSLLTGLFFASPAIMAADLLQGPCQGASSSPICQQNKSQQTGSQDLITNNPVAGPNGVLQTVTNVMALLTGILAVVMIIISGFQFVTAGGNFAGSRAGDSPSKAKAARARLIASLIGLIIVALSWTIITFVVQKFVK